MNILIIGAAGFIGSHLGERLVGENHQVIAIDNFDPYYPKSFKEENLQKLAKLPSFHFYEADIRDKNQLRKVFKKQPEIDVLIHLAARPGVRSSVKNPKIYQEINVEGTRNLLTFCRTIKLRKIIFAVKTGVTISLLYKREILFL